MHTVQRNVEFIEVLVEGELLKRVPPDSILRVPCFESENEYVIKAELASDLELVSAVLGIPGR